MEIILFVVPALRLTESSQMCIWTRIKIGILKYSGHVVEANRGDLER